MARVTAPADPLLPFSASIFPLIQFVSLTDFGDWHSGFFERLARRQLPPLRPVGGDAGASEFDGLYAVAGRYTMLDRFRAGMLVRQLARSLELPGDVIECGTGPGGISLLMALLIRARGLDKRVWVFDSFEGLPPPDRTVDREYQAGACAYSFERVSELFREHGVRDIVELRKGWLAQTLPDLSPKQKFCFAHIDVDLYASVNDAVGALHPRLADGGGMVFDDYYDGSGGVFKAVNEAAHRLGEVVQLGPTCQAFFSKGARPICAWRIEGPDSRGAPLTVVFTCFWQRAVKDSRATPERSRSSSPWRRPAPCRAWRSCHTSRPRGVRSSRFGSTGSAGACVRETGKCCRSARRRNS